MPPIQNYPKSPNAVAAAIIAAATAAAIAAAPRLPPSGTNENGAQHCWGMPCRTVARWGYRVNANLCRIQMECNQSSIEQIAKTNENPKEGR